MTSEREALAAVMSDADCASSEFPFSDESRADAILASDWLAAHDAAVRESIAADIHAACPGCGVAAQCAYEHAASIARGDA